MDQNHEGEFVNQRLCFFYNQTNLINVQNLQRYNKPNCVQKPNRSHSHRLVKRTTFIYLFIYFFHFISLYFVLFVKVPSFIARRLIDFPGEAALRSVSAALGSSPQGNKAPARSPPSPPLLNMPPKHMHFSLYGNKRCRHTHNHPPNHRLHRHFIDGLVLFIPTSDAVLYLEEHTCVSLSLSLALSSPWQQRT